MTKRQTVRWGILSTAKIGVTQVIPAMEECESATIMGVASRKGEAARQAARELGIPKYYDSYEAMLHDPDIDAVYNPLPNHLHVPWTLKAMEAGKHVLCEKPLAMSAEEADKLLEAAKSYPDLKVMEAFMYRFHPQWLHARELVRGGSIGKPMSIQSFFSYFNDDPENIRNRPDMGGGAMMDIGCYCISLARWLFDAEPKRVFGQVDRDPLFGTDRLFNGIMDFQGRTSSFTCSTQLEWHQRVTILGAKGSIEIKIPFNPPVEVPTVLVLNRDKQSETVTFEPSNHYTLQGEAFSRAILDDSPVPTPLADGVANMRVLENLLRSAELQQWVDC